MSHDELPPERPKLVIDEIVPGRRITPGMIAMLGSLGIMPNRLIEPVVTTRDLEAMENTKRRVEQMREALPLRRVPITDADHAAMKAAEEKRARQRKRRAKSHGHDTSTSTT